MVVPSKYISLPNCVCVCVCVGGGGEEGGGEERQSLFFGKNIDFNLLVNGFDLKTVSPIPVQWRETAHFSPLLHISPPLPTIS